MASLIASSVSVPGHDYTSRLQDRQNFTRRLQTTILSRKPKQLNQDQKLTSLIFNCKRIQHMSCSTVVDAGFIAN